jgi:sugar/nucleoside kinase (ribokinase family)
MADLIVVGDVMLDVAVTSPPLVRGGDVHGPVQVHPGGAAANTAVWAGALGLDVDLYAVLGADAIGGMLRDEFVRRGVGVPIPRREDTRTGTMLVIHEAGERSMVADRGANATLRVEDLPDTLEAAALFVSGYTLFDRHTEAVALEALARAACEHVAIDAASWPLIARYTPQRFFEATAGVTILFANEREAEALTGAGPERAALLLLEHYAMVVIKQGPNGATLASHDGFSHRHAPAITEVDPTGAGDAFNGVFLANIVRGAAADEALELACDAGADVAASATTWPVFTWGCDAEPRA